MKVELITNTPEIVISESAKVCYSTKPIEEGGKDITKSVVCDKGHLAVLRFGFAVFEVSGISVACHTQMLRSSHLDFLVESKRYVGSEKGNFEFIMPKGLDKYQEDVMKNVWEYSLSAYKKLLGNGVRKEDARAVLPYNISTRLRVAGNLQAFYDFLKLRLNPHAQLEIRDVAKEIFMILAYEYPQVFTEELYKSLKNG